MGPGKQAAEQCPDAAGLEVASCARPGATRA